MPDYKLDIGNSDKGAIGLCAYTEAADKREALAQFEEDLGDEISVRDGEYYCTVYLNWDKIGVKDIEACDGDEDDEADDD